jgi:predicted DNA binding protein/DNA-binding response OmpR family regulator
MVADGSPAAEEAGAEPTPPPDLPTVLVVDDDRALADTCEYWLREEYDVRVAYGGTQAIERVDDSVDVVLLDRRMPDVSGDDVLEEIDARGLDCRVAMMTAVAPDTDIVEMAFDEYLVKPVDEERVTEAVEELLVRAEFDDRVREYFALASTEAVLDGREVRDPTALDELTDRVRELRAERESEIRTRERQLEQTRRINSLLREIDRGLVDATTRADIVEMVCDSFATSPYDGAWVARYDEAVGSVECEAAAETVASPFGRAGGDSDGKTGTLDPEAAVKRAIETRSPATEAVPTSAAAAVLADPDPADAGRTLVAVPVDYRETVYGALVTYVRGEVTDEEVSMLEDVGETVGNGITSAESKQLLYGGSAVELEFEHADTGDVLVDLAREFDTTVRLEGIAPVDGGVVTCFLVVADADPEAVLGNVVARDAVTSARAVSEESGGTLFELRLADASAVVTLVELGAKVASFTATGGTGRLVVRVPAGSDLRTFTLGVQSPFPGMSVVAKREVDDDIQSTSSFRRQLEEKLTDRQQDVIETALTAGYFEWPRGSTAEEVASSLGIAAPTFHEHLRAGERKLIESFFSETGERVGRNREEPAVDD